MKKTLTLLFLVGVLIFASKYFVPADSSQAASNAVTESDSNMPPHSKLPTNEHKRPNLSQPGDLELEAKTAQINKLFANIQQKDREYAAKMKGHQERLPFRSELKRKTLEYDMEPNMHILQTWGFSEEQIGQLRDILTKRDLALFDLRQKRLAEPGIQKRQELSAVSKKIEEESRESIKQILGSEFAAEFEKFETTNVKRSGLPD
ncbi:MAG: hypothetical protein RIS79_1585 [Verrucomicrobiota bacterium]|jgi:hypothetical protein